MNPSTSRLPRIPSTQCPARVSLFHYSPFPRYRSYGKLRYSSTSRLLDLSTNLEHNRMLDEQTEI